MNEMHMLDQLENVLIECEKAPKENTPTMKAFIILARVVYYLLRQRVKKAGKIEVVVKPPFEKWPGPWTAEWERSGEERK